MNKFFLFHFDWFATMNLVVRKKRKCVGGWNQKPNRSSSLVDVHFFFWHETTTRRSIPGEKPEHQSNNINQVNHKLSFLYLTLFLWEKLFRFFIFDNLNLVFNYPYIKQHSVWIQWSIAFVWLSIYFICLFLYHFIR